MKTKLKFLIKNSLDRKIKNKWFVVVNILLAIAVVALININSIITYFGGDFDNKTNIYVVDQTDGIYDLFTEYMKQNKINLYGNDEDDQFVIINYDGTYEDAVKMLEENEDEKNSVVLVFKESETNVLDVQMISNNYLNLTDIPTITNSINSVKVVLGIEKYNISEEQILALTSSVEIDRVVLGENDASGENADLIMTAVFPIVILPFFMLVIFLVQMVGAEVNDEKTTKGMEIIISNVSPGTHFAAKAISGNVFVLLQGLLLIIYFILGLVVAGMVNGGSGAGIIEQVTSMLDGVFSASFISSLSYIIPLALILMVITFVAYSLVAGILASMTTNPEEFQQILTPIMLVLLIGYYLAIMASMFKGSLFIKIFGYIPFVSAILSPSLLITGDFGIINFIIAIIIMVAVVFILIKYGLKVYKVGILNYSSGGMFKKIAEALKK